MRILFVTWDGPQVHYLESLFLPIFAGLKRHGYHFDVLQFRWGEPDQERAVARACADAGIGYRAVPIIRRGGSLGAFASAWLGGRQVRRAMRAFGSDVLMPRSLMPALCVMRARLNCPVIFDADGLPADERVEAGTLSPTEPAYRVLRAVEAQMVRRARVTLVRSEAAARILLGRAGSPASPKQFFPVANGRDEALFTPIDQSGRAAVRASLGLGASEPVLVYAGSIGPQYRFDQVRAFAETLARRLPGARLLVLTGSPAEAWSALGEDPPLRPIVITASPLDVGPYLAAADLGLAFRQQSFAMQAVAPVKLGEYLLCGVPVVGTAGIGDTAAPAAAGVFHAASESMEPAVHWFLDVVLPQREDFRGRAREAGLATFSLRRSIEDYRRALATVAPQP